MAPIPVPITSRAENSLQRAPQSNCVQLKNRPNKVPGQILDNSRTSNRTTSRRSSPRSTPYYSTHKTATLSLTPVIVPRCAPFSLVLHPASHLYPVMNNGTYGERRMSIDTCSSDDSCCDDSPQRPPSLPSELNRFSSQCNRLKQILGETKKCFNDINISGQFEGTQIIQAELLAEEENEVTNIYNHPATIAIFGQTAYAKARIANELLGKPLFPQLSSSSKVRLRSVHIVYGKSNNVTLTLPDDYEICENLEAYKSPWVTLPLADLELQDESESAKSHAILHATQDHPMLRMGAEIYVSRTGGPSQSEDFATVVKQCVSGTTPVLVYGVSENFLSEQEIAELKVLNQETNYEPIFFVRVPPPGSRTVDTDPPDGAPGESISQNSPHQVKPHHSSHPSHHDSSSADNDIHPKSSQDHHHHHQNSHTVSETSPSDCDGRPSSPSPSDCDGSPDGSPSPSSSSHSPPSLPKVEEQLVRLGYLDRSDGKSELSLHISGGEPQNIYLENFTNFNSKLALFTKQALQKCLVNAASVLNVSHTRGLNMFIISAFDMARDMLITPKKLEFAKEKEEELYKSLLKISVSKLTEIKELISNTISIIGSCLVAEAAEFEFIGIDLDANDTVMSTRELQACSAQIREMVLSRLNHAVAGKLVSSVDILRDSYTGTLTRCLESLELNDRENPDGSKTTDALKQILNAAYTVEITVRSSSTFIQNLLEKMKQLVQSMPWKSSPVVNTEWKRKVAQDMLSSLSEARLAKSIASQIKERLNKSHESFLAALRQLETRHLGRLDKIEEHRLKLRKVHAPRLAKLALESTSLRDVILNGMPHIGREIGRGQYGVVYACDSWGSHSPCAIKSVVPPDDKHWNDLALEFFYTKNIPDHARVVNLRGSVIDYMYGGGTSPAVLLVMDRLQRDLYTAIKQGLDWINRLQVAIDVVEGLRYLHSQGLVHRDVKLKNVLLDKENRGKITDLGFCKPEAMMSGSIVGTPIHMAPELFTGHYDNSVDVYAFGILFWYVCAGHVRLPNAFEQCANKDQLWQAVKKGLRPENPTNTPDDCWQLMQKCWEGEPNKRPFFGDVETKLTSVLERYKQKGDRSAGKSQRIGKSSRTSSPRHSKQISPKR